MGGESIQIASGPIKGMHQNVSLVSVMEPLI